MWQVWQEPYHDQYWKLTESWSDESGCRAVCGIGVWYDRMYLGTQHYIRVCSITSNRTLVTEVLYESESRGAGWYDGILVVLEMTWIQLQFYTKLQVRSKNFHESNRIQSGALWRQVGNLGLTTLLEHLADCNFFRTLG
jgi:hypothetical protein